MRDPVQGEAEDAIGNAQGGDGDQQIGRLHDQVCRAVVRGTQHTGIEPDHQKGQQLGAKGAKTQQKGIIEKRFVFLVVHICFPALIFF